MKKQTIKRLSAVMLAVVMLCAALAGCGTESNAAPAFSNSVSVKDDTASAGAGKATEKPSVEPETEKPSAPASVDSANVTADKVSGEKAEPDMSSIEAILAIADLKSNYANLRKRMEPVQVAIDTDENPYDLNHHYGLTHITLYDDYVAACDWDLVFDIEFYKKAFPMLARQYNYDDALLKHHFQTIGIHEGRQGSERFNLAAYMENCDDMIRDAFGDSYECYYFYYMLNYDAEKSVDVENPDGKYPLWLDVVLTNFQYYELDEVNKYRAEVGVDPVKPHPELVALANHRAWYDAVNGLYGHDFIDLYPDSVDAIMNDLSLLLFSENTVKNYEAVDNTCNRLCQPSYNYKMSKSHYDAMVNPDYVYFGCSVWYYSASQSEIVQFDIFSKDKPASPYVFQDN